MSKPIMILFDYGNTLLYEPVFDALRGTEALFSYIKCNKNNLSAEQVNEFSQKLFGQTEAVRGIGFELHEWQIQRFLYEYLEIEFNISMPEAEKIFWDNASPGALMPDIEKVLEYINKNGIRSGVISNICFSGAALAERINRLLQQNNFEFIIASSEYIYRKPNPLLFELALKKAGLMAEEVWFCGDNAVADVGGASSVGIFPVWYEDKTVGNPWKDRDGAACPKCQHLHINSWLELIDALESIRTGH